MADWPIRILGRNGVVHAADTTASGTYRTPCGMTKGARTEVVDQDMTCQVCIDKIREAELARGW